MEFLKGVLSDELYAQLETALKDNKDIKLGNLAKGDYVGKDKFATLEEQSKALKSQIEEANKQIESFKGMDIDGIKKTADDYKSKYEAAEAKAKADLEALQFDHALTGALSGAKAKNATAVKALIDMNALKLADGKIIGLDEQLTKIKTDNDYLFESTDPKPSFSGKTPGGSGGTPDDGLRAIMGLPPISK